MDFLQSILLIFFTSLAYSAPLIITAMGGLISEKSGVVNIGLEGLMVVGAFSAAIMLTLIDSIFNPFFMIVLAILFSGIIGIIYSFLHAFATIKLKADQVISGTALNMLAVSITGFLVLLLFSSSETPGSSTNFTMNLYLFGYPINIGFLISLLLAIIINFIFKKTKLGLRIKATGENPYAVDATGLSVNKIRYFSVLTSGFLASIGGALFTLSFTGGKFHTNIISGLGFLAIAALIFGSWKPINTFYSSLFFGLCQSFSNTASMYFPTIIDILPPFILKILPYLLTLIALTFVSSKARPPKFLGKAFDKTARY